MSSDAWLDWACRHHCVGVGKKGGQFESARIHLWRLNVNTHSPSAQLVDKFDSRLLKRFTVARAVEQQITKFPEKTEEWDPLISYYKALLIQVEAALKQKENALVSARGFASKAALPAAQAKEIILSIWRDLLERGNTPINVSKSESTLARIAVHLFTRMRPTDSPIQEWPSEVVHAALGFGRVDLLSIYDNTATDWAAREYFWPPLNPGANSTFSLPWILTNETLYCLFPTLQELKGFIGITSKRPKNTRISYAALGLLSATISATPVFSESKVPINSHRSCPQFDLPRGFDAPVGQTISHGMAKKIFKFFDMLHLLISVVIVTMLFFAVIVAALGELAFEVFSFSQTLKVSIFGLLFILAICTFWEKLIVCTKRLSHCLPQSWRDAPLVNRILLKLRPEVEKEPLLHRVGESLEVRVKCRIIRKSVKWSPLSNV